MAGLMTKRKQTAPSTLIVGFVQDEGSLDEPNIPFLFLPSAPLKQKYSVAIP